jgi:hypothetical protein
LGGVDQNMVNKLNTQIEGIEKAYKDSNMTPEQIAAAKKTGGEEYDKAMPDRFGFLKESVESQAKDIKKQRSDNSNEALVTLGLNLMGTKSQYFLQAAGEAGLSAMQAFKQGQKDIKDSEANLLKSQTAFAQAESLRDQGKYSASERAVDRAQALGDKAVTQRTGIFALSVQAANYGLKEIETEATANLYNSRAANQGTNTPDEIYTKIIKNEKDRYGVPKTTKQKQESDDRIKAAMQQAKLSVPSVEPRGKLDGNNYSEFPK